MAGQLPCPVEFDCAGVRLQAQGEPADVQKVLRYGRIELKHPWSRLLLPPTIMELIPTGELAEIKQVEEHERITWVLREKRPYYPLKFHIGPCECVFFRAFWPCGVSDAKIAKTVRLRLVLVGDMIFPPEWFSPPRPLRQTP